MVEEGSQPACVHVPVTPDHPVSGGTHCLLSVPYCGDVAVVTLPMGFGGDVGEELGVGGGDMIQLGRGTVRGEMGGGMVHDGAASG